MEISDGRVDLPREDRGPLLQSPWNPPEPAPRRKESTDLTLASEEVKTSPSSTSPPLYVFGGFVFKKIEGTEETSCGNVLLMVDETDNTKVAAVIKVYRNSTRFDKELKALKQLKHPCIINMLGCASVGEMKGIALSYCSKGTLTSRIGKIDFLDIVTYFYKISAALLYIHMQGIVHGDIKPDNILFDGNLNPRISDFDLSTVLAPGQCLIQGRRGTDGFIPPEMELNWDGIFNGFKADAFSLGVVLMCMVFEMTNPPEQDLYHYVVSETQAKTGIAGLLRTLMTNLLLPTSPQRWGAYHVMPFLLQQRTLLGEFLGGQKLTELEDELIPYLQDTTSYLN